MQKYLFWIVKALKFWCGQENEIFIEVSIINNIDIIIL